MEGIYVFYVQTQVALTDLSESQTILKASLAKDAFLALQNIL